MNKRIITIGLAILCLAILPNCGAKKAEIAPELATSDEALFKHGQELLKKDAEKARLYFRQVIDSFPRSFYAQRAKLSIADSYFQKGDEGNMILAAAEYREFISLYPFSPSAPYAQHQIGMTYFKHTLKPGRDQTKSLQAITEFKKVLTNFPLSDEAKSSQEKIKDCEERLARHQFGIGLHYYRVSAFRASTERLKEILTRYPEYSDMDEVYFYLADSHFKWNKPDQAVPFFTKLITDYPKSKHAKKALKRMKEIDAGNPAKK